jgi:hypothetical protein
MPANAALRRGWKRHKVTPLPMERNSAMNRCQLSCRSAVRLRGGSGEALTGRHHGYASGLRIPRKCSPFSYLLRGWLWGRPCRSGGLRRTCPIPILPVHYRMSFGEFFALFTVGAPSGANSPDAVASAAAIPCTGGRSLFEGAGSILRRHDIAHGASGKRGGWVRNRAGTRP